MTGEGRRAAEDLAQELLEAAPDAFIVVDEGGRIVMVNAQAERLFGYRRAELLNASIEMLVPAALRKAHAAQRRRYMADPATRLMDAGLDLMAVRSDGSEFPVEVALSALRTGGGLLVCAAVRDVTERRAVDAALRAARAEADRANAAKSEFLSRMSHELRTPLNAILGFGQLLELEDLPDSQEESVRLLLRAGRHLLDLVNEVLDIARIESGQVTLSLEPVSIEQAAVDTIELIAPAAATAGIKVHVMPGQLDVHVQADRQRLQQVLLNLVSNAVKYNVPGGEVTLAWSPGDGPTTRIEVRDTGIGIPEELMGRLFQPFERLALGSEDVEGTGLGLALSRGLIEAMGGTMGAGSAVGQGSTFWCELPTATQRESDLNAPMAASAPRVPGATAGREVIVLHVEDNLSNVRLVQQILARRPGVRVMTALQGRLALELGVAHRPDLLLLDLHLPDMPGEEVMRRWRANPATAGIPVVVLSADATSGRIRELIGAGADEYLTKPLDVSRFLEVLDAHLP